MTTSSTEARDPLQSIIVAVRLYIQADGRRLIHVLKTVLAVLLATGISMRLELAAPRTAMMTAVILMMHQHSGMVLARGFYRGIGMLVGYLVALLLFALFPQERVLFLLVLSLWIGVCVCGAAYYRNYQSYGFVLAGYATCIAAIPSVNNPYEILNNAITGLSEVSIGILCASLTSALIFPQHVRDMLFRAGDTHFADFAEFVRTALTASLPLDELGRTFLLMISERTQLENLRSAAVFEDPDLRARNDIMVRLRSQFLDAGARFHALHQIRHRLRSSGSIDAATAIDRLCSEVARLLPGKGSLQVDIGSLEQLSRELDQLAGEFPQLCETQRRSIRGPDALSRQNLDTGVTVLEQAIASLRLYLEDLIAVRQPHTGPASSRNKRPVHIVSTANLMVSAATGARAVFAIAVVSLFWIESGWNGATGALISATVSSALYSIMPAPAATTRRMVLACFVAWLASLVFNFYLLPRVDGLVLLAATIAPFIIVGSYLMSYPKTAAIGLGFSIYFCFLSNLTNPTVYAPTVAFDAGFSAMLGISVASLAYSIVAPYGGQWVTGLYLRQLRRLVAVDACYGSISGLKLRFDSGVMDFVQQISVRPATGRYGQAELLGWSFASIEIGRSIIELREIVQEARFPVTREVPDAGLRAAIAQVFKFPSVESRRRAVQAVDDAFAALTALEERAAPAVEKSYERLRASLNFIHLSLLDNLLPLDLGSTRPVS